MKEFDIVHHHQHHQQQHNHPHHHHQQQQQQHHQSWQSQQQRQQHQTHTTSIYGSSNNQQQQQLGVNHSQSAQRSSIGQHQQQQNQHAATQLGQYHQQLQSTAHHNSAAAAAAYYQQQAAHLYPTYQAHAHSQQQDQQTQQQSQQPQSQQQQPQQQHLASDHSHHHVPVTGSAVAAVVSAAHGVVGQQQHGAPVHHTTPPTNTQASASAALGHAGWSPGASNMGPPSAHHAVVTDHSTLAYMTHAYQAHNTTINDPHHRNSNGSMSTQAIGSGPQASSYTVDSLYNTTAAAAAAAVAAYGYNNYNAAFFQTSNNGPHTQTGHPTAANLSTFWNQTTQPRTAHTQAVNNQQATIQQQQRQPITSEATNYMHDPRIYYGRPTAAYQPNQAVQNFGQTQHHTPPPPPPQQQQPQTDLIHHRMNALSQQHQILQHHEQQQLNQVAAHQQPPLHNHSPIGNHQHHQSSSNQAQQALLNQQHSMQQNTLIANQANTLNTHSTQNSRHLASANRVGPQDHQLQKQSSNELESLTSKSQVKNQLDYDQINLTSLSTQHINQSAPQSSQQTTNELEIDSTNTQGSSTNVVKDLNQNQQQLQSKLSSLSPVIKPQNPQATTTTIKKDTSPSQQFLKKPPNNDVSQLQPRNLYRAPQQQHAQNDRDRQQQVDTTKRLGNNREVPPPALAAGESRSRISPASSSRGQQDSDQTNSLEDSMASLTVGSVRKTTWASIASQPAKVAQPKSLKSKIAGSNSVLSSAKHLATVSLDSSLESKNGINPAIKSSVSAAATSIQRSSVPPSITKVPAIPAGLKLDLLGEESLESSKISWPAVNASINLTLDDPPSKESVNNHNNYNNNSNNRPKKGESYQPPSHRDFRDPLYKDHNHNQGGINSKMVNAYQPPHSRESWNRNRNDQRDNRSRRDSDRRCETSDSEKQNEERNNNSKDSFGNSRRDYKLSGGVRINSFRTGNGGEDRDHQLREREQDLNNKRGAMLERGDQRGGDGYQNSRFSANNRYETRDSHNVLHNNQPPVSTNKQGSAVENHQTQHHHYNNIRDGNTAGNSLSKLDLNLHPHLNPANFNPKTFNLESVDARYFIIKSYSEDDIHRSIKYSIWCSTNHGNKRLDEAYRQQQAKNGPIYLFFSVNGSGHFCGMAQMMSSVDFDSSSGVWAQSKWQGEFSVKWLYVKDVPNSALRHITLENNEDKPVTNSRDTQEVPSEKGKAVLRILHQYSHITSLFDDFLHYERRQEEEKLKKSHQHQQAEPIGNHNRSEDREPQHQRGGTGRFGNRPFTRSTHNERASRFAT